MIAAGATHGITPYGTEAMHVLRAEKGYIIVGQETDGTVTPHDLGMGWIVSRQKRDFIGKRSLGREDILGPDRKQLVGLLTEDPNEVLPEARSSATPGCQAADADRPRHLELSQSELGRSIAMGGGTTVLWLSIDQWLITVPYDQAGQLTARLAAALAEHHALVVDLSDAH